MKVTRKGFISSVATAVAATVSASASPALAGLLSAPSVKPEAFAGQIGSAFELAGPEGVRARVVLSDLVRLPAERRTEQFSLLFSSSTSAALPEGLYRVRHSTLGAFDLFLVPGGKKAALRADLNLLKA